jgi:hypothetical protein
MAEFRQKNEIQKLKNNKLCELLGLQSPDFCTWFSFCSQNKRRIIKDLYFIFGVYSQIWLNVPAMITTFSTSSLRDDSHFGYKLKKARIRSTLLPSLVQQ